LVEEVVAPNDGQEATRVLLVCLDDDNQGHSMEVLWELELGARVHQPEAHGLGEIARIDPPRHFAAYLHALKWNAVTATDGRLFQSPFRAGIMLQAHQLVPLQKALALPRANLFIADDVGLGKTIEAGLVLSELMLRQRVDVSLIVCPAALCLQWRDEMWKRFGIRFEVMSRAFVARRRKERGFGVNPWSTHARFIISHQLIRRPEYRDLLLVQLDERAQHGTRAKKSLLIVDEAHAAAPATASKHAVDSQLTTVMRDIAPRFENRLFLSATPHNGHSNSFSALLELLDPQRFTRGVKVSGTAELEPVMVRRLKQDLREARVGMTFPERTMIQLSLTHRDGRWQFVERTWENDRKRYRDAPVRDLGPAEPFELQLYEQLARYTEIASPKTGRGKLVFINLQKRLLSGVEAFARTLRVHCDSLAVLGSDRSNVIALPIKTDTEEASADDEVGADDETLELFEKERFARESRALRDSPHQSRELLDEMLKSAERYRYRPDAKVRALVDWISRNQCAGVCIGGAGSERPRQDHSKGRFSDKARWNDRRLIIFTEYGDTKRYLLKMLQAAVAGTDREEERILVFHGGMSDEQREEVQRAFNSPPADHPVRILVATDAAREGINLQAFCADLIHFDVPWNPARMEQRNGRIDRTLQPADEVFCRYFTYSQLEEADRVLTTLVHKIGVITRELGSLGAVVMRDIEETLKKRGITAETATLLQEPEQPSARSIADQELECTRKRQQLLIEEVEDASEVLERSKKVLELEEALRESPSLNAIPKAIQERVRLAAPDLFAQLWKPIGDEADARAIKAIEMLKARGRKEADQLREILRGQRSAIKRRLDKQSTLPLEFSEAEKKERKQFEADLKHMETRLKHIDIEIEQEPPQIQELYRVALNRLTPVGLVVLWPQTRL
jgi:superfamily II DNA/RNA helicase